MNDFARAYSLKMRKQRPIGIQVKDLKEDILDSSSIVKALMAKRKPIPEEELEDLDIAAELGPIEEDDMVEEEPETPQLKLRRRIESIFQDEA